MTKTELFILASTLLSTGFGIGLLIKLARTPQEKNFSSDITPLLYDGLLALSKRVLSSIAQVILYLSLTLLIFFFGFHKSVDWHQMVAFCLGSLLMMLSLIINVLFTPQMVPKIIAVSKGYLEPGLHKQFNTANAVSMTTFGLTIIGILFCKACLGSYSIIGYALGITLAAFFIRVSSGLFKSSAEISANTIMLQNKKMPTDHPNNPATLLDIIGTFIGSLVGFTSDILGSFMFSLVASILFIHGLKKHHMITNDLAEKLFNLPLFIIASSMLASLIVFAMGHYRIKKGKHNNVLLEGLYVSIIICGIATLFKLSTFTGFSPNSPIFNKNIFNSFFAYLVGLLGAILISITSEYLTSYRHKPTKNLAKQAEKGPVISVFNALISGLLSNVIYLGFILAVIIPAYMLSGVFGIVMASFGMLSVTSTMMMVTIFAPLAASTYKINALDEKKETAYRNIRRMDKIGQTTIALGKGFAAAAATLSTISLFLALLFLINPSFQALFVFHLQDMTGLLIGTMLPLIFCGLLLKSLKKLILNTQKEVLRQFNEIPYLLENKAKPDITKLAQENARASNDALIIPGILMALTPILIAFKFGIPTLLGFTLGTFLSSTTLNFFFATLGDTASNAKNYIQNGHYGGTTSPTYAHIQVTDSIGDAFKDLLGPGINVFMKSVAILAGLLLLILN